MYHTPIFKAEREAGLEAAIKAQTSVAYCMEVEAAPEWESRYRDILKARASIDGHLNLYPFKSLFCTAGVWNKNDDVLDREEVWAARTTPEDQPINIGHDCTKIIGHITETFPASDGKLERLADDLCVDELPDKYHLITGGVLYTHYDVEDLQKEVTALLKAIAENKKYVSMEVLFRGFDYAVIDPSGKSHVVARSEESAFLTKHLRAYGGEGVYQKHRVGRLMRNLSFSGKGIVDRPANPPSVIFAQASVFRAERKEISRVLQNAVYIPAGDEPMSRTNAEERQVPMAATELETLQSQLKAKDAELAIANEARVKAEAALKDTESKKLVEAEKQLQAKAEEIKGLTDKVAAAEAAKAKVEKDLADVNSKLTVLTQEVEATKAAQKKAERLAKVVETMGNKADAEEAFEQLGLAAKTDDEFTKAVEFLAKTTAAKKGVQGGGEDGGGSDNGKKKVPVKTLDVPGKKSADQKGVNTVKTQASEEEDEEGEQVNAEELDDARPEKNAELNQSTAGVADEKVQSTQAAIWDFLSKGKYLKHGRKQAEAK